MYGCVCHPLINGYDDDDDDDVLLSHSRASSRVSLQFCKHFCRGRLWLSRGRSRKVSFLLIIGPPCLDVVSGFLAILLVCPTPFYQEPSCRLLAVYVIVDVLPHKLYWKRTQGRPRTTCLSQVISDCCLNAIDDAFDWRWIVLCADQGRRLRWTGGSSPSNI